MIILTSFLTIGFVGTSIGLCWLSDKYSETLHELERYKRQEHFLQKQIKENRSWWNYVNLITNSYTNRIFIRYYIKIIKRGI